jgi:hypothetical protein
MKNSPLRSPSLSTIDKSNIEGLIVDSEFALRNAYANGFSEDIPVRSFSPGLCLSEENSVRPLERVLSGDDYDLVREEGIRAQSQIFQSLKSNKKYSDYAIVAVRELLFSSSLITNVMALPEEVFAGKIAVAFMKSGDTAFDRQRGLPWEQILGTEGPVLKASFEKDAIDHNYSTERTHPPFLERLKCSGWPRLGYRIFVKLFELVPWFFTRGTILIQRESPLVRETAYSLALRGYSIHEQCLGPDTSAKLSPDEASQLRAMIMPILESYLEKVLQEDAVRPVADILFDRMNVAIGKYIAARSFWVKELNSRRFARLKAVLSNAPFQPAHVALYHACRDKGIVFASFQHGVSKEMDAIHCPYTDPVSEISSSDIFFSFNRRMSEISDKLEFAVGKSVTVGMPIEYRRTGTYRTRRTDTPPVIYASTSVCTENVNFGAHKSISDVELCRQEIEIISRVLGKIPHRVLFKPYPEDRYLDVDRVLEAAFKADNLEVHTEGMDLTYLIPDARLIIVARCGSTISWATLSGKPVVFLNLANQHPLRDDCREAIEKGLFLFNDSDPNFREDLRAFISQPLDQIEALWQEKLEARKHLIEYYMDTGGAGAGDRAADYLMQHFASGPQ